MNEVEIQRLAHAINDLRADWPISSLTSFIRKSNLARKAYRDAAVALVWIATDTKTDGTPASDTPKRVLEAGPWWPHLQSDGSGKARAKHPPKVDEQCQIHPGQFAGFCGGCVADQLADDSEPRVLTPGWTPGDPEAGAKACREAMGVQR